MKLLGLTGGVAMGKSTVARMLGEAGIEVIDTDDLARQLVEPGEPALAEIRTVFGEQMLDEGGRLRRSELGRLVFSDPRARERLEGILHPRIRAKWMARAQAWREAGRRAGVVAIPLLFETAAESSFDAVVCVACTGPSQGRRLMGRGLSPEESGARVRAQWPIERKMGLADFVIWTEGAIEVTAAQVLRILRQLNLHPSF